MTTLADRLMSALPTSPLGTMAFTGVAGALLLATCVHWLGWWMTAGLLVAGAGVAAASIWRDLRSRL